MKRLSGTAVAACLELDGPPATFFAGKPTADLEGRRTKRRVQQVADL